MKLKYILLLPVFVLVGIVAKSQSTGAYQLADGGNRIPANLTDFQNKNIYTGEKLLNDLDPSLKTLKYGDVKGSPFWSDRWYFAAVYDIKNNFIAKVPVNMNFANGKIYSLRNGDVVELENDAIRKVVIYEDTISNQVKAVFLNFLPYIYLNNEKINEYLQVFHTGPAILLKLKRKELAKSEGSGGMSKYYFFKDMTYYYIQVGNKAEPLKKLSSDEILELLPGAFSYKNWANENNINFKKEADVIRFIEYYNSQKESPNK